MNLAQRFKSQLSATVRRNATDTTVFDLYNDGEYQAVRDEMRRPGVSKDQFAAMYRTAITSQPKGGFLHVSRMNPHGAPYSASLKTVFPLT